MNANILSQRTCISMVVNGRSKWRLNRRRSTSCLDEKIEWCQETTGNKIGVCTIVRYREVCYPNTPLHYICYDLVDPPGTHPRISTRISLGMGPWISQWFLTVLIVDNCIIYISSYGEIFVFQLLHTFFLFSVFRVFLYLVLLKNYFFMF